MGRCLRHVPEGGAGMEISTRMGGALIPKIGKTLGTRDGEMAIWLHMAGSRDALPEGKTPRGVTGSEQNRVISGER